MAYTATDVKNLRERTGAGMMDCKKALDESGGDMEAAVDSLRAKGLAAAAKKSSRTAAEGLVGVAVEGTKGVAVEVNSETDFVAKNDQFQDFVRKTTEVALKASSDDVEALKGAAYPGGGTVADTLTNNVATIGENQQLRRMKTVSVGDGVVVPYVHNAAAPNLGKIGVLVALESTGDKAALEALGKQLAMHIAAAFPLALNADDLDAEAFDHAAGPGGLSVGHEPRAMEICRLLNRRCRASQASWLRAPHACDQTSYVLHRMFERPRREDRGHQHAGGVGRWRPSTGL